MKRRQFLHGSLVLAGSAAAVSLASNAAAIEPLVRSKPGKLHLSLAAYSMRKYLVDSKEAKREMDLFGFVDFCHQLGLAGAELTSYYFPDDITDDYILKLKRHCHLRGVTPSGGAIRNDFCQQDAAKSRRILLTPNYGRIVTLC